MSQSLKPLERIRKKSDFTAIYKKGNRYRGRYFNLVYLPNDMTFSRMAVVASKKIGNAVERNKAKRWVRTLFRRNKELLTSAFDLIVITKPSINEATWRTLQEDYLNAITFIINQS
jgi:ribonuclease P protein component